MKHFKLGYFFFAVSLVGSGAALAQTTTSPGDSSAKASPAAGAPSSLVIYFESGSSKLRPGDKVTLDKASRTYNEGKPIVMIVTGSADRVGEARQNLLLSQRRATVVLNALLARGIPAERFQVLAKGETELPVPTEQGVKEEKDRRVEITWR